jgi:hypothetical protein
LSKKASTLAPVSLVFNSAFAIMAAILFEFCRFSKRCGIT